MLALIAAVAESPIKLILSGMTYYQHWFEEFIKSKNIRGGGRGGGVGSDNG